MAEGKATLPRLLEEKPDLPEHLEDDWECFTMVMAGRHVAVGASGGVWQPIATADAVAAALAYEIDARWFLRVVRSLDPVLLDRLNGNR